jgi:VWFA-related protein
MRQAQRYYVFYSKNSFIIRIASVLAGLLLGSHTLVAQNAPQGSQPSKDQGNSYELRVKAKTVILDVVVTDKQGHVVTNLSQEDFNIQEDGQPQRITSFERPDKHSLKSDATVNSTADLDREAPQAPVDLIVLDEINTRFEDMAFARYSLKNYLNAQPRKLKGPTMLVAVDLHHLTVLQDYTQDKVSILNALNQHLSQYPWHVDTSSWTAERFSAAFASLMQVAEATAGHSGHKNMIWIGRGFPDVRTDTMQPQDEAQLEDSIQLCINMLRDARITLYTVDPAGVPSAPAPDVDGVDIADPFGGNFQFNDVARATGGKAFSGRNDVNAEIGTSIRDGDSFYTLSYAPSGTSDAAKPFRRIRVVMKNSNLRAVAREGYYDTPSAEPSSSILSSATDRTKFDLLAASETTLVYDGIPIALSPSLNDPTVIRIHIGHEGIVWKNPQLDREETANIQVLIATFDRNSKLIARTARNLVVRNTMAEGDENKPQDINMTYRLPANDSVSHLRVVVRVPESGRVGAANMDLSKK